MIQDNEEAIQKYESFKRYATKNILSLNKLIEIATEAGLDVDKIKIHETTSTNAWHNVFESAKKHNQLEKLYDLIWRYHNWIVNHVIVPKYLDNLYGAMDRGKCVKRYQ